MKTILTLTTAVALTAVAPAISTAGAAEPGAKQMRHGGMMMSDRHHRGGRHGGSGMHGMHGMMMLQAADADGDRTVTRAELDALHSEEFEYRDRNGDGYLSIEDASPIMRRMHAIHMADAAGEDEPRHGPRRHMAELDSDDDGRVSRDEFLAHHTQGFDELDADGDDAVTPAELDAAVEAHHERRGERLFWWRD